MEGSTGFRHRFSSVILIELTAAVTQPHGPYIFRNALLELFQTSMGSVGLPSQYGFRYSSPGKISIRNCSETSQARALSTLLAWGVIL